MVAKSYQTLEQLGEPFAANGKMYVNVRLKSGNVKSVRWYEEKTSAVTVPAIEVKPQKEVLGFQNGYVTIFHNGGMNEEDEYFKLNPFRYCRLWGWYWPSDIELPNDIPTQYEPTRLPWNVVGRADGLLKSDAEVQTAISQFLYPSASPYVGSIGERLDLIVTITKNVPINTKFGISTVHVMEDAEGHTYSWTTGSKNWPVGSTHSIRGTVKEHNARGQTVLTRCAEKK